MAARLTGRDVAFLLGGATTGASLGIVIAHKALSTKYEARAQLEIEEIREHYRAKIIAAEPKPDLDTLVAEREAEEVSAEELVTSLRYDAPRETPEVVVPRVEHRNVFAEAQPDEYEDHWDYKAEIDNRDPTQPYVIHKDEFNESEEQEQSTLTYFEGDDVLCDERDTPQDNRDAMIGEENLQHFGHGSGDRNVLYVRNEVLGMDFEIVRSDGLFAQEVHGFEPGDLQHSAMRRRASRGFDDD